MKRFQWVLSGLILVTSAIAPIFGCAESTTELPPSNGSSSSSSSGGESSSSGMGSSSSSSSSSGQSSSGSMGKAKVVINEIQATTEDWVEIVNIGDAVADLSGMGLADQDTDGTPKVAEAVRFLDGESLVPGEYLLVVANLKKPNPGPQGDCLMSGGPATCYQAGWGISASNGDQLYLLSTTDEVVDTLPYPVNAVPDGESYCRLPNGIGDAKACKPTPGDLNTAP